MSGYEVEVQRLDDLLGFELVRQNQIRKGDDFLVCGDYVVVDI